MNDIFERRIRAAAIAGWWTLLVGMAVLLLQWGVYLYAASARPAWLASLWGPDVSWPIILNVWFWGMAGIKAFLGLWAVATLWLTFWARQLRKQADGR
jgi:hypothetical protein